MTQIVVFGIKGFSGRHFLRIASEATDWEIFGFDREEARMPGMAGYDQVDLMDRKGVEESLARVCPDYLINLAGSFTHQLDQDRQINVQCTRNILESLLNLGLSHCRVLLVGSSAEYGPGKTYQPLTEEQALNPQNAYGITKKEQYELFSEVKDRLCLFYARTFNLIGPGISRALFVGNFFEKIKAYQKGEVERLEFSDLSAFRDFIDIRDACSAYLAILQKGKSGEVYNVASGKATQVFEILKLTQIKIGIPDEKISIEENDADYGVSYQVGSIEKIQKDTAWYPSFSLDDSIEFILGSLDD